MEEKNARRFAIAEKNFIKAIKFNSNYTEAYIENAKVNLEMRKVFVALENFTKAYELQPSNTEVIRELAILYYNNHQFPKAIELAQKCITCTDAERILGMSYYHTEDYGKAVSYLQKAIEKNDKDAEAAYNLGRTYLELENEKKCHTAISKGNCN